MVQQMIVPHAVGQVGNIVPGEHEQHAVQELTIAERQREHLADLQGPLPVIGGFLGAGLYGNFSHHQDKGKVAQPQDQLLLKGRTGHGIGKYAAENQHHTGHHRAQRLLIQQKFGTPLIVLGVKTVNPVLKGA